MKEDKEPNENVINNSFKTKIIVGNLDEETIMERSKVYFEALKEKLDKGEMPVSNQGTVYCNLTNIPDLSDKNLTKLYVQAELDQACVNKEERNSNSIKNVPNDDVQRVISRLNSLKILYDDIFKEKAVELKIMENAKSSIENLPMLIKNYEDSISRNRYTYSYDVKKYEAEVAKTKQQVENALKNLKEINDFAPRAKQNEKKCNEYLAESKKVMEDKNNLKDYKIKGFNKIEFDEKKNKINQIIECYKVDYNEISGFYKTMRLEKLRIDNTHADNKALICSLSK